MGMENPTAIVAQGAFARMASTGESAPFDHLSMTFDATRFNRFWRPIYLE